MSKLDHILMIATAEIEALMACLEAGKLREGDTQTLHRLLTASRPLAENGSGSRQAAFPLAYGFIEIMMLRVSRRMVAFPKFQKCHVSQRGNAL